MSVDRNTIIFFDASCLVAASGSPTGGSGFLLTVCAKGFVKAAVSQQVLLEAQRNVTEQLHPARSKTVMETNSDLVNLLTIRSSINLGICQDS